MITSFFRQMMTFIEYIDRIFRRRKDRATTHHNIGQHKIVVGYNTIYFMNSLPGTIIKTILVVRTSLTGTLHVIRAYPEPGRIINFNLPIVAVSIPLTTTEAFHHVLIKHPMRFIGFKSFIVIKCQCLVQRTHLLQREIQPGKA